MGHEWILDDRSLSAENFGKEGRKRLKLKFASSLLDGKYMV